jgi:hypothetical protein
LTLHPSLSPFLSPLGTTDVLSPHGVPVDLLDRMLIIRQEKRVGGHEGGRERGTRRKERRMDDEHGKFHFGD